MMTSQLVRTLHREGLLRRAPHLTHSPAIALDLTDRGRHCVAQAPPAAAAEKAFFGTLGADVEAFAAVLRPLSGAEPRRRIGAGTR